MKKCMVCEKEVVWELVVEEFEDIFNTVDHYGVAALTEQKQHVYEGRICSSECLETID